MPETNQTPPSIVVESIPSAESSGNPVTAIVEHATGKPVPPERAYNLLLGAVSENTGSKPEGIINTIFAVSDAYGLLAGQQEKFRPEQLDAFWQHVNDIRDRERKGEDHRAGYSTEGLLLTDEESKVLADLAYATTLEYNQEQKFFPFASVPDRASAKQLIRTYWDREAEQYWQTQPKTVSNEQTGNTNKQTTQDTEQGIAEITAMLGGEVNLTQPQVANNAE
jgi:hypothetical protein